VRHRIAGIGLLLNPLLFNDITGGAAVGLLAAPDRASGRNPHLIKF
jgi:hypothetical protein